MISDTLLLRFCRKVDFSSVGESTSVVDIMLDDVLWFSRLEKLETPISYG